MKYEFLRGTAATQTTRNSDIVFGYNINMQQQHQIGFPYFIQVNLTSQIDFPKSTVNNEKLKFGVSE